MQASEHRAAAAPATISVTCRLFARYAEALGRDELQLDLAAGATVADAVHELRRGAAGGVVPERPLAAVNREHAAPDTPLRDGDEVALLPPLAGG
jgi:molybdopterin synthase catalytic subunit